MSQAIVRFAPSPTGSLHIGGVRTALFNYLFAKQSGGKFLLRIEDTDTERSKPEFEKEILDSLKWLGLDWDGDVIRQSERLTTYQKYSQELIAKNLAYVSEGAIRFKIPKIQIEFHDLVHGEMKFDSSNIEDFVIQKSNGFPTYHFACVVDDYSQGVTHVIRGDDHLSNTARHVLLYQAFEWRVPQYAHLPLVLGKDGEPLSKRNGEVNLLFYREKGFLQDGILNYLALLGWSGGESQEFFSKSSLIKKFSIKKVNSTNATFDIEKFKWVNGEHVKALSDSDFVRLAQFYLETHVPEILEIDRKKLSEFLLLYKTRVKIWNDFLWQANFFWKDQIEFDTEAVSVHLKNKIVFTYLTQLADSLQNIANFEDEKLLESCLRNFAAQLGIQAKDLIHPARVALTGKSVSPSLFSVMRLLGKEKVCSRLRNMKL